MKPDSRNGLVTGVLVLAVSIVTFSFFGPLFSSVGLLSVAPLIATPYLAARCSEAPSFWFNRSRLYALGGAVLGYAILFALIWPFSYLTRGSPYLWAGLLMASAVGIPLASFGAAWFSIKGCSHYRRTIARPSSSKET